MWRLLHCPVSLYMSRYTHMCEKGRERVITMDRMKNWSTCCLTQTSLFSLETVGVCQANKDNITFRVAHKTWNAIYRKGSFQNMAVLAVRGTEQRGWSPPVLSRTWAQGEDCTPSPVWSKTHSRARERKPLICGTPDLLKCKNFPSSIRVTKK